MTERVKIGFSALVLPLRPVPWLAAQVATLQQLSGGRLVLGVGSGGGSLPSVPGSDEPARRAGRHVTVPACAPGEPVEPLAGLIKRSRRPPAGAR
ncbi:LLM class flavin-dependent oxidoreductase [Flindersiella endophytica]